MFTASVLPLATANNSSFEYLGSCMSTKARKRHSFVSNAEARTADGLCLLQHLVHHLELLVDAKQLPHPSLSAPHITGSRSPACNTALD